MPSYADKVKTICLLVNRSIGFESRTPRHFPPEISAISRGPFLRLQNVSKSGTSFWASARGNVTDVRASDPVHPREVPAETRRR
jgi:hypothetical protein